MGNVRRSSLFCSGCRDRHCRLGGGNFNRWAELRKFNFALLYLPVIQRLGLWSTPHKFGCAVAQNYWRQNQAEFTSSARFFPKIDTNLVTFSSTSSQPK